MSPLLASSDDLSLLTPIPLVLHPAAVYLDCSIFVYPFLTVNAYKHFTFRSIIENIPSWKLGLVMFTQRTTCYRSSINGETPSTWGSLTDVSLKASGTCVSLVNHRSWLEAKGGERWSIQTRYSKEVSNEKLKVRSNWTTECNPQWVYHIKFCGTPSLFVQILPENLSFKHGWILRSSAQAYNWLTPLFIYRSF